MTTTLSKAHVVGYKSIADQEITFSDLNLVIGPNGAGKSNLIGAFRFLERIVSSSLQLHVSQQGGAERFFHHGSKATPVLSMTFRFGENGYAFDLVPAVGDTVVFQDERIHYRGFPNKPDYWPSIGSGHKESLLEEEAHDPGHKIAQHVLNAVRRWVVYHFHDTSDSAPCKKTAALDDNRDLRPDAANLAPFLRWMKDSHATEYRQVVEHVRLVAPFFEDFVLEPSRANPSMIKLEWRQRGSDAYFDGYSLSDGTLRFICMATLLLQPTLPTLVLLDEPELGLHPFAMRILADLLESAARRSQVVVATQSVTLLNHFAPEHVIVAEHDGQRSTFRRLVEPDLAQWLEDYALGELWEKNVLGGRP